MKLSIILFVHGLWIVTKIFQDLLSFPDASWEHVNNFIIGPINGRVAECGTVNWLFNTEWIAIWCCGRCLCSTEKTVAHYFALIHDVSLSEIWREQKRGRTSTWVINWVTKDYPKCSIPFHFVSRHTSDRFFWINTQTVRFHVESNSVKEFIMTNRKECNSVIVHNHFSVHLHVNQYTM